MPALVAPDLSDLDARDAQNRPLRNAPSVDLLTQLFTETALFLTLQAPTHGIGTLLGAMNAFLYLFNNLIFVPARMGIGMFSEALRPSKKRFVHNVDNLWTTISVEIFVHPRASSISSTINPAQPIPLRC